MNRVATSESTVEMENINQNIDMKKMNLQKIASNCENTVINDDNYNNDMKHLAPNKEGRMQQIEIADSREASPAAIAMKNVAASPSLNSSSVPVVTFLKMVTRILIKTKISWKLLEVQV